MVRIENLTFGYAGASPLFRDMSLSLAAGGIYALLGFSGVGKTTFLKLVGGLVDAQQGGVLVDRTCGIGYVPQEPSLLPWLTVRQNLGLGGQLLGNTDGVEWRDELATSFALERFLDDWPRALSGGMKQRAAVISALASGAHILLLDEPFAGSDRVRRAAMYDAIKNFRGRVPGSIVVFTTHDPGDVFALGASAIWLDSVTREPTEISTIGQGWTESDRVKLLELMMREAV